MAMIKKGHFNEVPRP